MIIIQYMRKPLQTSQSNGVTAKKIPIWHDKEVIVDIGYKRKLDMLNP